MPHGNYVMMAVHLTANPLMVEQSQTPICTFSGGWNDPLDKDEARAAHFIDFKAFGKTAEVINEYARKGRLVIVEGKVKQERWTKDGQNRSRVIVYVDSVKFTGNNDGQNAATTQSQPATSTTPSDDGGW